MPLQCVPAPREVWQTEVQSLLDLFGLHFYHLPVGALALEDLVDGATLGAIVPSGSRIIAAWDKLLSELDSAWTELIPGHEGGAVSCEMTHPGLNEKSFFRGFTHGEIPAAALARIAEAHAMALVQAGDFELRFLSVPGIQVQALHLVCNGPGSDLILPIHSMDSRLATDAVLEAKDFLNLACGIAKERLALPRSDLSS